MANLGDARVTNLKILPPCSEQSESEDWSPLTFCNAGLNGSPLRPINETGQVAGLRSS